MASDILKTSELMLIRQAVSKHAPSLLPIVDILGVTPLTSEQREGLRGALASEMVETGLNKDSEPNERGLLLDGLITRLWYFSDEAEA
jgi:hypothetical protein